MHHLNVSIGIDSIPDLGVFRSIKRVGRLLMRIIYYVAITCMQLFEVPEMGRELNKVPGLLNYLVVSFIILAIVLTITTKYFITSTTQEESFSFEEKGVRFLVIRRGAVLTWLKDGKLIRVAEHRIEGLAILEFHFAK